MPRPVAHLANLDLNLLVALRELLRERSVTRAAERLGVTQPAASAALSRLRRHFGDELLVRDRGESLSTEYSEGIRFIDGMVAPPTHGFALPDTRSAELFRDRWVCLVDAHNPALDAGQLRLADLARLPWVAPYCRSSPNPSAAPIMHQLELLDIRPRIAVRVESYLAVPHFVAGTDRIALMQERLAARLADRMDLRVLECPGQPEPIAEALWWHRQYEDDTAHAWLRRLIVETARQL
jgi:DNA-binding transcriptional LysR family regulator